MRMIPDETPPPASTPPEVAEAHAPLAEDEQEWLTMRDEAFDLLRQAGVLAEARRRARLARTPRMLARHLAQHRAADRTALARRRALVGKLADKAGLLGWDTTTLDHLFTLLAQLRETPNPVAVLDALLTPRREPHAEDPTVLPGPCPAGHPSAGGAG